MRYHCKLNETPIRMTKILQTDIINCWQLSRVTGTVIYCCLIMQMQNSTATWKAVQQFLTKLNGVSCNSDQWLLGIGEEGVEG